jgi:hypothetical protein
MQASRFELKYMISETMVLGIRDFVRPWLVPDEYADPANNNSYMIHSLYLDNRGLALRQATVEGHKNRFKLRIRFYDDVEDHPVFYEIKGRIGDVIKKERTAVHRSSVDKLMRTPYPDRTDLFKYDAKNLSVLQRFCSLQRNLQATGRTFVSYLREAYVSPDDDSVRVTFDRQITASPHSVGSMAVKPFAAWLQPPIEGVVLELKFTDRFPKWMGELVKSFNLRRDCMAKYVYCAETAGRDMLSMR